MKNQNHSSEDKYPYTWFFKKYLGERKGQRCRVVCRGRGPGPRNVLVEFPDGFRVVSTRFCVRKVVQLDLFEKKTGKK